MRYQYHVQLSIRAQSADAVDASYRLSHSPRPERPPWAAGAHVASEQEPRIVIYPNFLSDTEADHVCRTEPQTIDMPLANFILMR